MNAPNRTIFALAAAAILACAAAPLRAQSPSPESAAAKEAVLAFLRACSEGRVNDAKGLLAPEAVARAEAAMPGASWDQIVAKLEVGAPVVEYASNNPEVRGEWARTSAGVQYAAEVNGRFYRAYDFILRRIGMAWKIDQVSPVGQEADASNATRFDVYALVGQPGGVAAAGDRSGEAIAFVRQFFADYAARDQRAVLRAMAPEGRAHYEKRYRTSDWSEILDSWYLAEDVDSIEGTLRSSDEKFPGSVELRAKVAEKMTHEGVHRYECVFLLLPPATGSGGEWKLLSCESKLAGLDQSSFLPVTDDLVPAALADTRKYLRSIATALAAYYVDNGRYPASVMGSDPTSVSFGVEGVEDSHTFTATESLLGPVKYIAWPFHDYFYERNGQRAWLSYYSVGQGYAARSAGPDGDYDIPLSLFQEHIALHPDPAFKPTHSAKAGDKGDIKEFIPYLYDPTNGLRSSGDILFYDSGRTTD